MKKVVSIALCAVLILFAVTLLSCQDSQDKGTADVTTAGNIEGETLLESETEDPLIPDLPDEDFGGYEFRVISRGDDWHSYPVHSRDIWVEGENGEIINDAVYKRNLLIEEKFNIKIKLTTLPELTGEGENGPILTVQRAHAAGEDSFDLVMGHEIYIGTSASAGYYNNWYDIPYVDLSKPWWNQEAITQLSIGQNAFLALSDLGMGSYDHAYCILFNKKHHADYNVENLYDLVDSGKWTFDKLHSIYADMYIDLDGNEKRTIDDFYGFIEGGSYLNWFFAGGNRITQKDDNNLPYYDLVNERSVSTFDKASAMTLDSGCYRFDIWINEDIIPMFSRGNGFFLGTQVGSISQLRGMEVDFGIIPYPKFDETQEGYYNFIDGHASLMGVPKMVQEVDKVGAIIEALSYESYKSVRPAYYDVALKGKFSRDNESENMLDIVFNGTIYDFDYVFGSSIVTYIFFENLKNGKENFVSDVERNMSRAETNLVKVIDTFNAID